MTNILVKNYFSSGELESEHYELNGLKHGTLRRWYKNGKLFSESTFINGKIDGLSRLWNEDGVCYISSELRNGVLHGEYISRWDSGSLKEYGFYVDGKRQPGYKYYREDGSLWHEIKWINGVRLTAVPDNFSI
jgi:antitoxin component YwqK of YwqJK toxin-antitoxin module